jgi:hypothetical protein
MMKKRSQKVMIVLSWKEFWRINGGSYIPAVKYCSTYLILNPSLGLLLSPSSPANSANEMAHRRS